MNTMRTQGYEPIFLTTSLRNTLHAANIDPDKFVKVKSENKVRTVSPLGHSEGSIAAAVDMLLLKGVVHPHAIIDMLDNDPGVTAQRRKSLKRKEEINMSDLLRKVNSHICHYARSSFDEFFTKTFGADPKVVRALRKACTAYIDNTWKPGLKEYKKALDMACLKVAEEIVANASQQQNTEAAEDTTALVITGTETPPADTAPAICQGTTKAGLPCKARAGADGFCRAHSRHDECRDDADSREAIN